MATASFFYTVRFGIHTNPKIIAVAEDLKIHRGIIVSLWMALIEYAKKYNEGGVVSKFDLRVFSVMVGLSKDEVLLILNEFEVRKMVSIAKKGEDIESICLINWDKYQMGTATKTIVKQNKERNSNGLSKDQKYRLKKKKEEEEKDREIARLRELAGLPPLPKPKKVSKKKYKKGSNKRREEQNNIIQNNETEVSENIETNEIIETTEEIEVKENIVKEEVKVFDIESISRKIYAAYKARHRGTSNEKKVLRYIADILRKKIKEEDLLQAIENYYKERQFYQKIEPRFIKDPINFFGRDSFYEGFLPQNFDSILFDVIEPPPEYPPPDTDKHPDTGEYIKPSEWLSLLSDNEREDFELDQYSEVFTADKRLMQYEYLDTLFKRNEYQFPEKYKKRENIYQLGKGYVKTK